MNVPYVKQYDDNGVVTNPIVGSYKSEGKNRSERRKSLKKERFHGESNNHHLTVIQTAKYHRVRQVINCRDPKTKELTGEKRVIEHYLS